jgi:hemerythrin-like domain-containing protein
MQRHAALIPLTHDHHHTLAQARRMLVAVRTGAAGERLAAAQEFLEFYSKETLKHFREEEEVLLPFWVEHSGDLTESLQEILAEHVTIHALVRKLRKEVDAGEVSPELLRELSEILQGHIRKEEDHIFPMIEKTLSEELDLLNLGPRDRMTK